MSPSPTKACPPSLRRLNSNRQSRLPGFTLVELLVVIAVLGILAAILIPSVRGVLRSVRIAETTSNMRQVFAGIQNYASQNQGRIVPVIFQNPGQNEHWAKILVDSGALGIVSENEAASETAYTQNPVFASPRILEYFGDEIEIPFSIAMNVRLGYRSDPPGFVGVGTMLQAEDPSRTLLLMESWTLTNQEGYDLLPNFWPTLSPPAELRRTLGDRFPLLFLDGHVAVLSQDEIPFGDETPGENRLFWRGVEL